MQWLVKNAMYVSQGGVLRSTEGMLFIIGYVPGALAYLTFW